MPNKDAALVVEDEPSARDSIVFELREAGFEVLTAETGIEASYLLARMPRIDLLLINDSTPGPINGWVLAEMARYRHPNLPVICIGAVAPRRITKVENSYFCATPNCIGQIVNAIEAFKSSNTRRPAIDAEPHFVEEPLASLKQDLRLLDDELKPFNARSRTRGRQLSLAHGDAADLLDATHIPTIFLDRKLAIKHFTLAAKTAFQLVEDDIGRPISHVRSRLGLVSIQDHVEGVLRTLGAVDAQIERDDGKRRYLMRILPYLTLANEVEGVVINFIDVTRITAAEDEIFGLIGELRAQTEKMERVLNLIPVGLFVMGDDLTQPVQVNRYAARLLGEKDDKRGPRDLPAPYRLFDHDHELRFWEQPLQLAAFTGRAVPPGKYRLVRMDGGAADVTMSAEPLLDQSDLICGAIAVILEI